MQRIELIEKSQHGKRDTCTVKELILALTQVQDQNAEVITEGCDCYGKAVVLEDNGNEVTIARR